MLKISILTFAFVLLSPTVATDDALFGCLVDQLSISSMNYTKTNQENSKTLKKHQNIDM